jgi:hypothetical protein
MVGGYSLVRKSVFIREAARDALFCLRVEHVKLERPLCLSPDWASFRAE